MHSPKKQIYCPGEQMRSFFVHFYIYIFIHYIYIHIFWGWVGGGGMNGEIGCMELRSDWLVGY